MYPAPTLPTLTDANIPVDLTICPHCGRPSRDVASRRINTAYVDDNLNQRTECGQCHSRTIEYYDELWDDYNRSRG